MATNKQPGPLRVCSDPNVTSDNNTSTGNNGGIILQSGSIGSSSSPPVDALAIIPTANSAAANVCTMTNAAMGQATTLTLPDPGAASANVLLSTGTANTLTDYQCMIGPIGQPFAKSAGTWTLTRIAAADYSWRHTAAAETVIVAIDITEYIRTTASKGFKLVSIDVITKVGTLALTSATPTLSSVAYANNVANAVTSVPIGGTLSTATQANPYVDNLTVTTPAFLNTADSKYVLEISYVFQATTAFDLYGINLRFSNTIA